MTKIGQGALRLLFDTHIIVWSVVAPRRLGAGARAAIVDPANEVFVSAVTAWEISIKVKLGRLAFPLDQFGDVLAQMGVEPLPISLAHATAAGALPRHHDDPFDRMLVAQARSEPLVVVTEDAAIARYEVMILGRSSAG